jgi:hypothetical protein
MRWEAPRTNDSRIRKRFLFLPMEIDGEVRWWEIATWLEYYHMGRSGYWWRPERWL